MDIRTMQYFLAVIREGTISAAAQALHVAQPSLSRQMRELEEELGTILFVRGNRKITLTEEGMVLRKRAEEIFADGHDVREGIAWRIGSTPSVLSSRHAPLHEGGCQRSGRGGVSENRLLYLLQRKTARGILFQ